MAANTVDTSELAADISELKRLLAECQRARVKRVLERELEEMQKEESSAEKPSSSAEKPIGIQSKPAAVKPSVPRVEYTTLSTFSWDQDSDKLKIYIFLEGASQDKVIADFTPTSFDVKLQVPGGKNHRAAVHHLGGTIDPKKSAVLVKPKRITITMPKAERKHWTDLYHKENKFDKKGSSAAANADPMAGIMDLMKNLYDEGDDEMKKMIAKSWTEARSGNRSDPLKDMDYGFPKSSDNLDL